MKKIILIIVLLFAFLFPSSGINNDAVVTKFSTQIIVSKTKCTKEVSLILQINNPQGDKFTSFYIPYSDNRKLKKLSGEIKDLRNESIRKLSNKDIITSSLFDNSNFYNDNLVKRFSLKHNVYPYLVQVNFQWEISPYIGIVHWYPIWDDEIATQSAELTVTIPSEIPFKLNPHSIENPEITETPGGKIYHWESSYERMSMDDIYSPSIYDRIPFVEMVPTNFNYIVPGSFESWKAFGEWELSVSKGLDDLTDQEKIHIDKLTEGISDPKEIISILYHYMQDNTRYVSVDIDLGGLKPYPASYVCNNRFGDCKALSNYMQALLAYKGIQSNCIDINAGVKNQKIYSDFPAQQFNHVLLAVSFPSDTIWLECTSNTDPVNYLGPFTQNRPALWIEKNNSRLVRTPALKTNDVNTLNRYSFEPVTENRYKLDALFLLRGSLYEKVISVNRNWSEKEKKDYFSTFLAFKNYLSEQFNISNINRDSGNVIFETSGYCNSPFQTVGEFIKVDLPPMNLPAFEKVKERELPVNLTMPLAQTDTIYYELNADSLSMVSDKKLNIENRFGKLSMELFSQKGDLKVVRKYEIPSQEIPLAEYKEFFDFLTQLNTKGGSIFVKPNKSRP